MAINGIVNAGVNGGPSLFKEAFLSHEFKDKNQDKKDIINRLRANLRRQFDLVEQAIKFHAQICSNDMRKLQETLEGMMIVLKTKILDDEPSPIQC